MTVNIERIDVKDFVGNGQTVDPDKFIIDTQAPTVALRTNLK